MPIVSVGEHTEVRGDKPHDANRHAGPEVLAHNARLDLGSGQEGQQDCTKACEEVDPICNLETDEVARDASHHDLDECDGNRNAN